MKKVWTDEQFKSAIASSRSYADAMRALGISPYGFNYNTVYKNVKRLNLSTEHFYSKTELLEIARKECRSQMSDDKLFAKNGIARKYVKKRIMEKNLIPYICNSCNSGPTWNNKPLVLHLDHINGDNTDNRLENLQFLCPNCHSQTDTYCGKNVRTSTKNRQCPHCKKEISYRSKTCKSCVKGRQSKIVWLPVNELLEKIKECGNLFAAGKALGVSDNAIRKRLRKYGINGGSRGT